MWHAVTPGSTVRCVRHAQDYQRLLGTQPTRRLNPSKIAESSVIKNKLVDTIAFLENLSVKVDTRPSCCAERRMSVRHLLI